MTTAEAVASVAAEMVNDLRGRILFTLTVYPKLSPTMLQVALGTGTRPQFWHPVLDQLIEEGRIEKIQIRPPSPPPSGRDQVYTVIQLRGTASRKI
jgi:hypothetical protein